MKKILFLLLIYIATIQANEEGCTISFFNSKKSPCASTVEKHQITIAPIVVKKKPDKETIERKEIEVKLYNILTDVKEYKKKNQKKTKRLKEELNAMKREFQKYKTKKDRELKKIKNQLYSSKKKIKKIKKKLVKITKKVTPKVMKKKPKKHLYSGKKKVKTSKKKLVKITKKVTPKVIKQKPKKKETTVVQVVNVAIPESTPPLIHKVVHKMQPTPILMYDTPWIEIVIDTNTNIYDLALKYYGNAQEYKKIYLANQNIISNDLKIYNGMTLVIPMAENFKEQGIVLNQ